MKKAIQIDMQDNVATVIENVSKGQQVEVIDKEGNLITDLKSVESISLGHKIALRDFSAGESIIKYGFLIGKSTNDIVRGSHVHVHNMESQKGRGDLVKNISSPKGCCK